MTFELQKKNFILKEYDWAWKKIGGEPPKMRDQYSASPLKKHDRTYYWRNIPKDAIRELYIVSCIQYTLYCSDLYLDLLYGFCRFGIPSE